MSRLTTKRQGGKSILPSEQALPTWYTAAQAARWLDEQPIELRPYQLTKYARRLDPHIRLLAEHGLVVMNGHMRGSTPMHGLTWETIAKRCEHFAVHGKRTWVLVDVPNICVNLELRADQLDLEKIRTVATTMTGVAPTAAAAFVSVARKMNATESRIMRDFKEHAKKNRWEVEVTVGKDVDIALVGHLWARLALLAQKKESVSDLNVVLFSGDSDFESSLKRAATIYKHSWKIWPYRAAVRDHVSQELELRYGPNLVHLVPSDVAR